MVMIDREKVIDYLNDCIEEYKRGKTWVFVRKDIVEDALELLKEQPNIVRCKDCRYWDLEHVHDAVTALDEPCKESYCQRLKAWDSWGDLGDDFSMTTDDWYCADGERKEGR